MMRDNITPKLNKRWQFMMAPEVSLSLPFPVYLPVFGKIHTSYTKSPENHKLVKKQRWRISDASFPFPSSFNRNYERSKASGRVTRFLQWYSTAYSTKFMDVTEPKREFDKYPQVRLLNLAERVLVMADPLQQGHGVKTQHWNGALISSSSDPSQSSQITRLDRSQWLGLV